MSVEQNEVYADGGVGIRQNIKNTNSTAVLSKRETNKKAYFFVKRVFDILISSVVLMLLSPLFLIIAIIIKIQSPGPVIYKRKCVSQNGYYDMYKFRTMVTDADNLEKYMTPEQITEYKKEMKLDDDPRITKIGKLIRETSIDELPQFMDILKGDMSLIGPRPMVEDEAEFYGDDLQKVLSVKPGITGYWQTHGRSNCTYESGERQKLELYYAECCSLLLDLKIFFKTFMVVLKREGAK